jgi:peptide-methionine (S)-S-oxide reductase
MALFRKPLQMPTPEEALPGRDTPITSPGRHLVLGTQIGPPFPENTEQAIFGMGCFWGADRPF